MTMPLTQFARYGKHCAVFLAITMGATQCANTSDGRLAQGQGTAIGAGGGALIGALIGGRKGALIGAGVGGLAGFAYGTHIANKKAQYKSTEEWLDACIAQANSKRKEAVPTTTNSTTNWPVSSVRSGWPRRPMTKPSW